MTYEQLKKKVVDENGWVDNAKVLRSAVIKLAIATVLLAFSFFCVTALTLGAIVSFLVLILFVWIFFELLNLLSEADSTCLKIIKLSKFWWVSIIILVGVFITLKLLNFI